MAEQLVRLITRPHFQLRSHGEMVHIDQFEAWLPGAEVCELIVISRQPRVDAARGLLRRGYSPDTLLTTRAHGRDYDSWKPEPIGELAKWTMVETSRDGIIRRQWKPPQSVTSTTTERPSIRKSGLAGVHVPGEEDSAERADPAAETAA